MPTIQRINLGASDFAHADWTDPANDPPESARPFKITKDEVVIDIIGRASTAKDAARVDVDTMQVDGFIWFEAAGTRGASISETSSGTLTARLRLSATGHVGSQARLNLTLTGVTIAACEVVLVSGGRLL